MIIKHLDFEEDSLSKISDISSFLSEKLQSSAFTKLFSDLRNEQLYKALFSLSKDSIEADLSSQIKVFLFSMFPGYEALKRTQVGEEFSWRKRGDPSH